VTEQKIRELLGLVAQLWPRCKWTADEVNLLADKLEPLSLEDDQWRAVLREHRATPEGDRSTPRLSVLLARLRECDRANRGKPEAGPEVNPQRRWRGSPEEAAAVEAGRLEALAWVQGATQEELDAAYAALWALIRGRGNRLLTPGSADRKGAKAPDEHYRRRTKEQLLHPDAVNARVALYAAHRMARRAAAGAKEATR